jgi:hypothetical protein
LEIKMERHKATKFLRELLDGNNLSNWHIRLTTDITKPFLGLCSYKDKTIILNAHHIDTHPDAEIFNTIKHEVAHSLTEGHNHDEVWAAKAREIGCDNTLPCATYSFSPSTIDAIRSGAQLKVDFTEEVQVIRTPKYTISRLQDHCPICGKVAKEKSSFEQKTSLGRKKITFLECGHILTIDADSQSAFEDITFDGDESCSHQWDKTVCIICNAKRLYPFQVEGARKLEISNGRCAIFDEMGLGKTIQATAYLKFHQSDAWPFLWVTKNGTIFQHAREIVRVIGFHAMPQILRTSKDRIIPKMNCIASYDIFRRFQDINETFSQFQTLILDECQAIKNPDSSRTQCIRTIAKNTPKIIPLSGTPWKNRGSEFFVVLNMLNPKMFPSYQGFKNRYVDSYYDSYGNTKEGGIKHPKKFREQISSFAIRRERIEVLPELPLVNRMRVLCEVPKHARKIYEEEEDKIRDIYNSGALDGTENSFDNQSAIMTSLMVMRQIVGIAKVPSTVNFAQEFLEETDRKLAIFVHHKKCGELILSQMTEFCKENEFPPPLSLTADLDSAARADIAEKFNGPDSRLIIASTLASGEGLNLQSCADCIMHERQWNPANEEQAEGRFIRIGQKAKNINATYIHGDDTVDTILNGIVEPKRIAFNNTMNKGIVPAWNENDIIKGLVEAIVNKKKRK